MSNTDLAFYSAMLGVIPVLLLTVVLQIGLTALDYTHLWRWLTTFAVWAGTVGIGVSGLTLYEGDGNGLTKSVVLGGFLCSTCAVGAALGHRVGLRNQRVASDMAALRQRRVEQRHGDGD